MQLYFIEFETMDVKIIREKMKKKQYHWSI